MDIQKIATKLNSNEIGVIPTDTIYGISGIASNIEVVERIYKVKNRDFDKPFIILIPSIETLKIFEIKLTENYIKVLNKIWPGKVSVIIECPSEKFEYLHRETKNIAFRLPNYEELLHLLRITGPLVSTSANISGAEPANTIEEAKNYFGKKIDFYVDGGTIKGNPSTVIQIKDGVFRIIREGDVKIDPQMLEL